MRFVTLVLVVACQLCIPGGLGQQAPHGGSGGNVLHDAANPKLLLFGPPDTAGINTYKEAEAFCKDRGRVLATDGEWCLNRTNKDVAKRKVWLDFKPGYSVWAPVRGGKGDYIKVAIGPDDVQTDLCSKWNEMYATPVETNVVEVPEVAPLPTMCEKPANCTDSKCFYECAHPRGFYPDPKDCRSYCYCSGPGSSDPSWYETVTGDPKLVWDPYCSGSAALNKQHIPLG